MDLNILLKNPNTNISAKAHFRINWVIEQCVRRRRPHRHATRWSLEREGTPPVLLLQEKPKQAACTSRSVASTARHVIRFSMTSACCDCAASSRSIVPITSGEPMTKWVTFSSTYDWWCINAVPRPSVILELKKMSKRMRNVGLKEKCCVEFKEQERTNLVDACRLSKITCARLATCKQRIALNRWVTAKMLRYAK